jgi:glycosyltransferase involved in cell wall biosynthesis
MKKNKIVFIASIPTKPFKNYLNIVNNFFEHPASWVVNLINEFSENNETELHVISESLNIKESRDFVCNNIFYHFIKSPKTFNLSTLYIFNVKRIRKKIHEINPDLIHVHGFEGPQALSVIGVNIPVIISIQGVLHEYVKFLKKSNIKISLRLKLLSILERFTVKRLYNFGYRTDFDKNYLKNQNDKAELYYLPEAINKIYFKANLTYEKNIVFLGTLNEIKNPISAINIFKEVSERISDIHLNFIGNSDDKYQNYLMLLIDKYKMQDKVSFLGYLYPESIVKIFEKSSILLCTSVIENSSNSILEAMASGLVVVANNVGGNTSLIENEKNGFLIDTNNVNETSNLIFKILTNKEKIIEIRKRAKETVYENNYPSNVIRKYLEVYKNLIQK